MRSYEDIRTRDKDDRSPIWKQPIGGDVMRGVRYLKSRFVLPEYQKYVPEDVRELALMQDYNPNILEDTDLVNKNDRDLIREYANDPDWQAFNPQFKEHSNSYVFIEKDSEYDPTEVEAAYMLDRKGWKLESSNDNYHFDTFINPDTKKAYISFGHYSPGESTKSDIISDIANNNVTSDTALTLRNIPLNRRDEILQHPYLSLEAENQIKAKLDLLKESGYDVKFSGYSLGGYLAKHWGSKLNIDQEVINAHVFPYNTFDETSATTTFHTISTDETNFKYKLPNFNSKFAKDIHKTYPPLTGLEPGSLDNPWGHHLPDSFTQNHDPDVTLGKTSLMASDGTRLGGALETVGMGIGVGAGAISVAEDFKRKDYESAGVTSFGTALATIGGEAGSAAGGGLISSYMYGKQAKQAADKGDTKKEILKASEAAATAAAPIAGAAAGGAALAATLGGVAIEVTGSIDTGMQTYSDIKHRHYGNAAAHGIESAGLGIGAGGGILAASGALAPETGGLSLLGGAVIATAAAAGNWIGTKISDKKKREKRKRELEREAKERKRKLEANHGVEPIMKRQRNFVEHHIELPANTHWVYGDNGLKLVKYDDYVENAIENLHRTPQRSNNRVNVHHNNSNAPPRVVHGGHATE